MHENYKVINHYTSCLHNTHSAIDFLVVLISVGLAPIMVHSKWAKTPSLLNQFSGLWGRNHTIMCTRCLYIYADNTTRDTKISKSGDSLEK